MADGNGDNGTRAPAAKRRVSGASWALTGLLVVAIAAVAIYGSTRPEPVPVAPKRTLANVEVQRLAARPYREALLLPARIEADRTAAVSTEFQGKLARWRAAEGERVAAGQVVAELDTESLEASLRELEARRRSTELGVKRAGAALEGAGVRLDSARKEAQLRRLALDGARSDLELARTEHERARTLVAKQVLDSATLDTRRNALTQAEVRVQQAEESAAAAELAIRAAEVAVREADTGLALARSGIVELDAAVDSLRVQIAKAALRAPIEGRLEQHLAEPGEVVASGAAVAQIFDLDHLRAVANVPDRYVAFLDPRNPALSGYLEERLPGAVPEVRAVIEVPGLPTLTDGDSAAAELPAEIARIAQAADPASNTFEVELRAANPGNTLKHGVIARARIEYLTYPNAIVIPVAAVQVTDAGPRVLVVERVGGRDLAAVRDIEPASVRDDALLVLGGLTPGDRLIVAGWKGLVTGEEVNVVVEDGVYNAVGGGGE